MKTPLSWVEQSLSTLPINQSGPGALCGFTRLRTEATSFLSMMRAWWTGLVLGRLQLAGCAAQQRGRGLGRFGGSPRHCVQPLSCLLSISRCEVLFHSVLGVDFGHLSLPSDLSYPEGVTFYKSLFFFRTRHIFMSHCLLSGCSITCLVGITMSSQNEM